MSGILNTVGSALGWDQEPSDEVSIVVDGQQISGWESVIVRMSVEVMPWTFELETTEWFPDTEASITITAGSACQVFIGSELVITGYVIAVTRTVEAESHTVRVSGASKSTDLVECSAIFNTYQIDKTNALDLANKLTAPFGIKAVAVGDIGSTPIQQFDVILTETPYEIIERVCRFAAVLVYDDTNGNIILSRGGSTLAWSGFVEGDNVERFSATMSMAERYSEIRAVRQTTDTLFLSPDQANLGGQVDLVTAVGPLNDPSVPRYRPLIIPAEMGDEGNKVTTQRLLWEMSRRWGRSAAVELTCDSWRDTGNVLWAVNTLAPVSLPSAKCTPANRWLIGEVVLRKDLSGTHADIVLMPPEAFEPQPILVAPLANDVGQALRDQQASGGTAS